MEKITSSNFFYEWFNVVTSRKKHLLDIWQKNTTFTNYIKGDDNSVINEVAEKLNLKCYSIDYYSIDTILYLPEDKVPNKNPSSIWFRDIRVAFEHENNFKGGLYQEVSHLLIVNADLKVLVTYPSEDTTDENTMKELKFLHEIISGNRQSKSISEEESFLIILGYEKDFEWEALVYKENDWKKI